MVPVEVQSTSKDTRLKSETWTDVVRTDPSSVKVSSPRSGPIGQKGLDKQKAKSVQQKPKEAMVLYTNNYKRRKKESKVNLL